MFDQFITDAMMMVKIDLIMFMYPFFLAGYFPSHFGDECSKNVRDIELLLAAYRQWFTSKTNIKKILTFILEQFFIYKVMLLCTF